MTRVVIIDDHAVVREGLKRALSTGGFEITEAENIAQARAQIARVNPEVIVVDLNLPDGSGFEIVTWGRQLSKSLGIVVLSIHDDGVHIIAAMKAGASSYVSKSAPLSIVVAAITHALASPLSFTALGLSKALAQVDSQKDLTAREYDLLALLEMGRSTKEISTALFISQATVKTHLASIYRKLEVTNRTAAVHAMKKTHLPL